jgi:lysophospholipase L1-like esterase
MDLMAGSPTSSSDQQPQITVHMIGDSTMADKPPERAAFEQGWGQALPGLLNENARVANHAQNGRSSRSFIEEGLWTAAVRTIGPGDWLIIQFGHNDNKEDPARHTDPFTTYTANLTHFATEARDRGAHPVICTSIVRANFSDDGVLVSTHGDFPTAAIRVARDLELPLLDLESDTARLVTSLWPDRLKEFYVPEDSTHLTPWGAEQVARLATHRIVQQDPPLASYLAR